MLVKLNNENLSKLETYSSTEEVIGTWLGKPLYRKVFIIDNPTTNNWTSLGISAETAIVENVVAIRTINPKNIQPFYYSSNEYVQVLLTINDSNEMSYIMTTSGTWQVIIEKLYIVANYTKLTD